MRLVQEARAQDPDLSVHQAVLRIGQRTGVNPDTLRGWLKQAAVDRGERAGTTTGDAARIRQLERENHELKRAPFLAMLRDSPASKMQLRGITFRTIPLSTRACLVRTGNVAGRRLGPPS
jgi:transposase-like protein